VSEVVLWAEPVSFAYANGRRAVDEVTVSVRSGETLALVGPNGAGKTTFFALVRGLFTPTSGRMDVFGRSPREACGPDGCVMPQEVVLPAYARVDEVLRFLTALCPEALPLEALWR
jgi:ABC-2 type transport system ATP-binding protein